MQLFRCSAIFVALVWGALTASAHAILLKATPAVNQEISGGNTPIELHFNSRIDAKRSKLTLVGPDGKAQTLPISEHSSPDTISSEATGLVPGAYVLQWQVLAADGHLTRGHVAFKVH